MFYKFRRGLSREECVTLHYTVKNRFNEFNCGGRSLTDEVREGPPNTAVVSENIGAVHKLLMPDRHVT